VSAPPPLSTKPALVEDSGQPPTSQAHARGWAHWVATFGGIGLLKPGPGTWGSAATVLLWWAIARNIPTQWQWIAALAACAIVTAIGIPAATREARASGREDPGHVVIDEVAGQLLALVFAPLHWKSLVAGFILFRCFDIVKPWPVRRLERLPAGTGIVVDDLGAGAYAWAVMQVLLRSGILS